MEDRQALRGSHGEVPMIDVDAFVEWNTALPSRALSSSNSSRNHSPRVVGASNQSKCTILELDAASWVETLSYLSFRDVCSVGSTCRGLWSLHLVDYVWFLQELFLRQDMWEARGYKRECGGGTVPPLAASSPSPSKALRYERFKNLKVLVAKDFRREWHFKELSESFLAKRPAPANLNRRQQQYADNHPFGVILRPLTSDPTGRVLKSALRVFQVAQTDNNHLRPHQLLTICDSVAASIASRHSLVEITEAEDSSWMLQMLIALSPRQGGNNMLHNLGPQVTLIEISHDEAVDVVNELIVHRESTFWNIVGDFTIDPDQTRYFIGPELLHNRRVGIVAVDSLQAMVVVCEDD